MTIQEINRKGRKLPNGDSDTSRTLRVTETGAGWERVEYKQGRDSRLDSTDPNEVARARTIQGTASYIRYSDWNIADSENTPEDKLRGINSALYDKAQKAAASVGSSSTGEPSNKVKVEMLSTKLDRMNAAIKAGNYALAEQIGNES